MQAIKNPTAKTLGNLMPRTEGHVDGVIEHSINVRKFGMSASTVDRIKEAKRAAELEKSGRGPISGGVSIPAATLAKTRSMAKIAAALLAGVSAIANETTLDAAPAETKSTFLGRLGARLSRFGLNKKGHAA